MRMRVTALAFATVAALAAGSPAQATDCFGTVNTCSNANSCSGAVNVCNNADTCSGAVNYCSGVVTVLT